MAQLVELDIILDSTGFTMAVSGPREELLAGASDLTGALSGVAGGEATWILIAGGAESRRSRS